MYRSIVRHREKNDMKWSKAYSLAVHTYGRFSSLLPGGYALPPLHVVFLPTFRCNLKCRMCHYLEITESGAPLRADELTVEETGRILAQLPFYCGVSFGGGEPMARKDIMELLGMSSARLKTHIVTNGTLISEDRARSLVEMGCRSVLSKGLLLVGVSLEGPESEHENITGVKGSFGKTIKGLELLISHRKKAGKAFPLVGIQTVITPDNVQNINWIFSLGEELGVDICNYMLEYTAEEILVKEDLESGPLLSPPPPVSGMDMNVLRAQLEELTARSKKSSVQVRFSPFDITSDEILRYYSGETDIKDYVCRTPWSKAIIGPSGGLWLCPFIKVGELRQDSFGRLWNSARARDFRARLGGVDAFPGCMGCCSLSYTGEGAGSAGSAEADVSRSMQG